MVVTIRSPGPLEDEAGHMGRWLDVLSKASSSPQWPKGAAERNGRHRRWRGWAESSSPLGCPVGS